MDVRYRSKKQCRDGGKKKATSETPSTFCAMVGSPGPLLKNNPGIKKYERTLRTLSIDCQTGPSLDCWTGAELKLQDCGRNNNVKLGPKLERHAGS
jgi:hypothetical protein